MYHDLLQNKRGVSDECKLGIARWSLLCVSSQEHHDCVARSTSSGAAAVMKASAIRPGMNTCSSFIAFTPRDSSSKKPGSSCGVGDGQEYRRAAKDHPQNF